MDENGLMKTCKVCYKEIDARAKVCRYCSTPQSGPVLWSARHPMIPLLIPILAIIPVAVIPFMVVSGLGPKGEDFSKYRDQVKVISSAMHFEETDGEPVVWVVGKIRNDSKIAWNRIEFEVQFMNKAGELMDVARYSQRFDEPRVPPGSDAGFKVKASRDFSMDNYASYKVFITYAKDIQSIF